jgi:DNA-binding NarL/FixJ family response regulator
MSCHTPAQEPVRGLSLPSDDVVVALVGDGSFDAEMLWWLLRRDGLVAHGVTDMDSGRRPHIVVIAYDRFDRALPALIGRVRRRGAIPVVVVGVAGNDVRELVDAGAMAVVERAAAGDVLGSVIRLAMAHHVCIPASALTNLHPPALSFRERQVLALVLDGLTNRQIAARLFLSESTVKGHMTSAFRRLNARSRREVTRTINGDDALRRFVVSAVAGPDVPPPPAGGEAA